MSSTTPALAPGPAGERRRLPPLEGVLRLVAHRLRATLPARWRGYAVLALLIAFVGGIAMASVMAARRTQSSYPAFLANTNASDLTFSTYGTAATGGGGATYYSPKVAAAIARLPQVRRVESWVGVFAVPLERNGAPDLAVSNDVNFAGSNGLFFQMDRATPIAGRLADPTRVDEFMMTALGARLLGVHLGQSVEIGLYTASQANQPGFGTPRVAPARRFRMKLVGIVEFNNEVVEDVTDLLPTNVVYTPAFTRLVPTSATAGTWYGIQLRHHASSIAGIEQTLLRVQPPGAAGNFSLTATTEAKVERAVRPESIALGVFGLIAALAAFGTALPVVSRQLRSGEEERLVLRAMGAGPMTTLLDGTAGPLLAIVVGSLLACGVAVGLSPLSPLGPVRRVYHPAGVVFDWTVLGIGLGLFMAGLTAAAALLGLRSAPERLAATAGAEYSTSRSRLARLAATMGLPLPGVVGLHLALEPGRGRTAVPARSVLAGAVVAVATVSATLTFGASLQSLVAHPGLYGWDWDDTLMSTNGVPPQALAVLDREPAVAAWSGYHTANLQVDGQTVPALTTQGTPTVAPPLLSGHKLQSGNQVILGASTLTLLHKQLGSTVTIGYGAPNTAPLYLPPTPAVVVGTATFPAVAGADTFEAHTEMGTGLLVSLSDLPASFLKAISPPDPTLGGPDLVLVRFRPGWSQAASKREMDRVVGAADEAFARDPNAVGDGVMVVPVQQPAEIVNYQSSGATPELLATALAVGAIAALALALGSTVRRRRRDLAVLKTLGFTGAQVAFAVSWQATVTALAGVIVGVPVGIAAGRQLWDLFARSINALPEASIPVSVSLVVVGALLLANVVAAVPGHAAATTPAGVALREE